MTNTFFKSKEQYFQFRASFAAASKHTKSKSTVQACDEWLSHESEISYNTGSSRMFGWLCAEHFIFLNIMRGKPYHYGFTPVTNKNKLSNGGNLCPGLDEGVRQLRYAIHSAKEHKQYPTNNINKLKGFLSPLMCLDDSPSYDEYADILCVVGEALEAHTIYYSYFGEGRKVAEKMLAEDLKPKNYEEFMKIVEEINNV